MVWACRSRNCGLCRPDSRALRPTAQGRASGVPARELGEIFGRLSPRHGFNLDPGVSIAELLARHRDKVLEAAACCGREADVHMKYEWLIRYHNSVVASLTPHGVNDRLLINAAP